MQIEAVKVEIKKRIDGKYNVYQEFTINSAVRQGKEALFYHDVADSEEEAKDVFDAIKDNKLIIHRRIDRWVTITVLQNKKLEKKLFSGTMDCGVKDLLTLLNG